MRKVIVVGSLVGLIALGAAYVADRSEPARHAGSPAFTNLLNDAIARLEGVTQEITATTVGEAHAAGKQLTVYGEPTCDHDQTECWDLTYDPGSPTCEASMATCDATETCSRFYTCDSQYTCHGEVTCDGNSTCWNSTCDEPDMTCDGISPTCDAACTPYTMQGNYTCDGTPTCHTTCMGWPGCGAETMYPSPTCDRDDPNCWDLTYDAGSPTCEASMATCDATETCSRFYTCDSQYTCHGEVTCNGQLTCWNSTCDEPELTCDGSFTCADIPECVPYTMQGNFTCDGIETCHNTCAGWPNCGPTSTNRTTWGELKKEFAE